MTTATATASGRLPWRRPRPRRWTRLTLSLGLALLGLIVLACAARPLLGLPGPNEQDLTAALEAPSLAHPFGTDNLGRDVLSRTLAAGLLDLRVAITVTAISVVIGLTLGAAAGFFGRGVDAIVMRLADFVLAFPFLVLILAVVAIFGPGLKGLYVGVPLVGWALYARLTRAEMLIVREREYVLAARTLGYSTPRILLRHALPNVWRPALVFSTSDVVLTIWLLATLSYLGLGVQPPTAEWGGIIADGQGDLLNAWWVSTLPGVVVVLVGIGFSLVGDALAEILGQEVKFTA